MITNTPSARGASALAMAVAMGVFTATESAAIACVYSFILTYFVFRSAKLRNIGHVFKRTLKTLAIVLTLIAVAKAFAHFSAVKATGDAARMAPTPMTASSVWLRHPSAQPRPKAMPVRRPLDMPMLSTMRLSGPGVAVSSTAASRKARIWVVVNMGGGWRGAASAMPSAKH